MALPLILLREFQSATISDYIPGRLVSTYQVCLQIYVAFDVTDNERKLEFMSHRVLSKGSKNFSVHFHFDDLHWEGKALPSLWNDGAYLNPECLRGGKLHLFAHFEKSKARSLAPRTPAISTTPSLCIPTTEETPLEQSQLAVRRQQQSEIDFLSDSDSDTSGETNFLLSPSKSERMSDDDDDDHEKEEEHDVRVQESRPPFPLSVTTIGHAIDFKKACLSNAPKGKFGHKERWDNISKPYKAYIAHAKLIKGKYGLPSAQPCTHCVRMRLVCRIYHPDLRRFKNKPGSCGECLLNGRKCSINETSPHFMRKRKGDADAVAEESQSKKLRRITTPQHTGMIDYHQIAFRSCLEGSLGRGPDLSHRFETAHPGYDSGQSSPLEHGASFSDASHTPEE